MNPQDPDGFATEDLDELLMAPVAEKATEAETGGTPPSTAPVAESATDAPATEVAPVAEPVAETPTPADTPTPVAEPATPIDPFAVLDTIDPAELEKHPKVRDYLAARAGRIAQAKLDAADAERARKAQIATLKGMDPAEIGEQVLTNLDQEEQRRAVLEQLAPEVEERERQAAALVHQQTQDQLIAVLPPADQARVRQAIAKGEINTYGELNDAILDYRLAAKQTAWEAEERTRIEQEVLARHRLTAPRPDVETGGTPREMTDEEFIRAYSDPYSKLNRPEHHARADRLLAALT